MAGMEPTGITTSATQSAHSEDPRGHTPLTAESVFDLAEVFLYFVAPLLLYSTYRNKRVSSTYDLLTTELSHGCAGNCLFG